MQVVCHSWQEGLTHRVGVGASRRPTTQEATRKNNWERNPLRPLSSRMIPKFLPNWPISNTEHRVSWKGQAHGCHRRMPNRKKQQRQQIKKTVLKKRKANCTNAKWAAYRRANWAKWQAVSNIWLASWMARASQKANWAFGRAIQVPKYQSTAEQRKSF